MKAPVIYVVVRRTRDVGTDICSWSFDEDEARAHARVLNGDNEFGSHGVEEVEPVGGRIERRRW